MLNTGARPASYLLNDVWHLLRQVDWWLTVACSFLLAVGLTMLRHSGQATGLFEKQLEFVVAGVVAAIVFWRIPYSMWLDKKVVAVSYGINLALLLAVMLRGHAALGAQRWLSIGPLTLQPSEIAKLVVIFSLAAWLKWNPVKRFWDIGRALVIILLPAALVFKQPDLGTSLTFGAIFLGMVYWAGAGMADLVLIVSPVVSLIFHALSHEWWVYYLIGIAVFAIVFWRRRDFPGWARILIIVAVLSINFGCGLARPHLWGMLKEYQQKRLTSFINPYQDPRGSGYHILQSLIAIGSGGFNGAGLGHGNQTQGAFIPERHTDFIFAVVGEELGFRISALVVLAYTTVCLRALMIAHHSRAEPGGSLIAIGLMCLFLFHVFLNIGMTMGIMPVAGVPLPFLSYGGTAVMVDLISIGLLMSIGSMNPPPRKDAWE